MAKYEVHSVENTEEFETDNILGAIVAFIKKHPTETVTLAMDIAAFDEATSDAALISEQQPDRCTCYRQQASAKIKYCDSHCPLQK